MIKTNVVLCLWRLLLCVLLAPAPGGTAAEPSPKHGLARQLNQEFVDVAEKASPAVVVITVTKRSPIRESQDGHWDDSMPPEVPRDLRRGPEEMPSRGEGSGIILRQDGYILTNRHVVEDAVKIEVRLQDGRSFEAQVRGTDRLADLAVLRIEAAALPAATFADSDKTRVGEFAIAIGAPFSLDYSVTFGHVSAKGRSNVIPGFEGATMEQDFIQTDANINPGNSGGPLVNIDGEVIGINTLIAGLRTGIGFAIPSNLAKEISDQIISTGHYTRPWLGIGLRAFRDDLLLRERISQVKNGVVISAVMPDGPAAEAGLKANDIITAVDGERVNTPQQFRNQLRAKPIGRPVNLEVFRKDKTIQFKVSPAEWVPSTNSPAGSELDSSNETASATLGLTVHMLTPELAAHFGVEMMRGVIVTAVEKGLPADLRGLRAGDIITSVNQKKVTNPWQFQEALKEADAQRGVAINFRRAGAPHFEVLREGSN